MMTVNVSPYGKIRWQEGESLLEVIEKRERKNPRKYLAAIADQKSIVPLSYVPKEGESVELLDNTSVWGYRIYTKTVTAIFLMACEELFPGRKVKIMHFLGSGLYAEFEKDVIISHSMVETIQKQMKSIVARDLPIEKKFLERAELIEMARERHLDEAVQLYETIDCRGDDVHRMGDFSAIFHGDLALSTGYVPDFAMKYYYPGVLIVFPSFKNNYNIENYREQVKLSKVFSEASEWAEIIGLAYLGNLNKKIQAGEVGEIIRVSEALQEKKIMQIADLIHKDRDIRIVLIAGPTSSGKTSFSHRLSIALRVNGLRPVTISMDDYFVNREDTPRGPDGKYDFESLQAIDLAAMNKDLIKLFEGDEVELPKFDFKEGKRVPSGHILKVDKQQPIIVEGIHGLNPRLSLAIPEKNIYKIYISALTQLNIDAHNRIPTTDTRLLRRLVRDNQFRKIDPETTFGMWVNVRKAEERYIFPFQERADVMFDSALVYELAVLKKHALPLLQTIGEDSQWYMEAQKLIYFLSHFVDIYDEHFIPNHSLLREFIGGSTFDVH